MKIAALCLMYLDVYPNCSPAKRGVLMRMQSDPLGRKKAPGSSRDYIEHCRARRQDCSPFTVMRDVVTLRDVLAYAKPGWGYTDITDAPIREAWPILTKEGLVGSSERRTRLPSDEETTRIASYFRERVEQVMADIVEFQEDSTRRISETCRLQWGDLNEAAKTVLVRDMKHPKKKLGNHKRVALPDKSVEIIKRQPRLTTDPAERIFKISARLTSRKYNAAALKLGMHDLHLHDSRRGGTTRLFKEGRSVWEVMLVTGHERPDMPLTTYNGLRADDFHKRRAA